MLREIIGFVIAPYFQSLMRLCKIDVIGHLGGLLRVSSVKKSRRHYYVMVNTMEENLCCIKIL